ncbi:MAG: DUF1893 domain-containing protein [Spirochaetales bacterium]|nr:DUF1893 domain-containing protein [Spirochaetales bacterium]
MNNNLEVYQNTNLIFHSNGRWVYPLFDLENYIKLNNINCSGLFLKDKIAGRAAAHLMCYMGFKKVHIGLLSKLGLEVFKANHVDISWDELTDRIKCRTETLLEDINDSESAYRILKKRAGLFSGIEIECSDLSCGYNKKKILSSINLTIEEGEALIVKGDNGQGKTTFFKTISGLQPSLSGSILYRRRGESILPQKGKIGILTQNNDRASMPVLVSEIMKSSAALMGLKGEEKSYQIEISLRRTGALELYNRIYYELSGGERQRVNLARLICQRSGLFILDEPTSHLDKKGCSVLIELLQDIHYREMPTILVSSHDSQFIESMNWDYLTVNEGKIYR